MRTLGAALAAVFTPSATRRYVNYNILGNNVFALTESHSACNRAEAAGTQTA